MRKEKIVTLDDRGNQLTFKIREMSALQLEGWIIRAGLLLASTGLLDERKGDLSNPGELARQVSETIGGGGLAALGRLDFDAARPLLDELLGCCFHLVDGVAHPLTPGTVDGVIADVRTLLALRKEALALNFSFFGQGGQSASPDAGTMPPPVLSRPKISARSQH